MSIFIKVGNNLATGSIVVLLIPFILRYQMIMWQVPEFTSLSLSVNFRGPYDVSKMMDVDRKLKIHFSLIFFLLSVISNR